MLVCSFLNSHGSIWLTSLLLEFGWFLLISAEWWGWRYFRNRDFLLHWPWGFIYFSTAGFLPSHRHWRWFKMWCRAVTTAACLLTMSFLRRTVNREYKHSVNAPVEKVCSCFAMLAPLIIVDRPGPRNPSRHAHAGEAQPASEGYKATPSKGQDVGSDRHYPPLWFRELFVRLRNWRNECGGWARLSCPCTNGGGTTAAMEGGARREWPVHPHGGGVRGSFGIRHVYSDE